MGRQWLGVGTVGLLQIILLNLEIKIFLDFLNRGGGNMHFTNKKSFYKTNLSNKKLL